MGELPGMCELVRLDSSTTVYVADIKSGTISQIPELASLCPKIDFIYLFGSCLETRCTNDSDIDLAIIANIGMSKLINSKGFREFKEKLYNIDIDQDYDFLYFRSVEQIKNSPDFVCRDIIDKGKIIYEKEL
jgi:predicted nucleotidyltransferase|nr:nucleotidyltransferase domain-containing protein [uncultured Acetatifactor sp.]